MFSAVLEHLYFNFISAVASPPVRLSVLLAGFQTGILSLLALALDLIVSVLYLYGVSLLRAKGRKWPKNRTVSFLVGVIVIFLATGSGLASYDDKVFVVHVIQHLMLMDLAPILLVLSAPFTLLIQASKRPIQIFTIKVLHSGALSVITFPPVAWLINYVTMYVYFLTPVYELSIKHPIFHDYTHLHFLIVGMIMWYMMVGIDPMKWKMSFTSKIVYLVIGIPVDIWIALSLVDKKVTISPAHTLADVHRGGALLGVMDLVFAMCGFLIIVAQKRTRNKITSRNLASKISSSPSREI